MILRPHGQDHRVVRHGGGDAVGEDAQAAREGGLPRGCEVVLHRELVGQAIAAARHALPRPVVVDADDAWEGEHPAKVSKPSRSRSSSSSSGGGSSSSGGGSSKQPAGPARAGSSSGAARRRPEYTRGQRASLTHRRMR
jgi:hypothetical protein